MGYRYKASDLEAQKARTDAAQKEVVALQATLQDLRAAAEGQTESTALKQMELVHSHQVGIGQHHIHTVGMRMHPAYGSSRV